MTDKKTADKIATIGIFVAIALAIIAIGISIKGLPSKVEGQALGAAGSQLAEDYDPYIKYNGGYNSDLSIKTTADITVGSSGNAISKLIATTCNLTGMNVSHPASTTRAYDCAVSGLLSTDRVFAQLSTTTITLGGTPYWTITSAGASSTNGFATVLIWNNGPAVLPSITSVGSSTKIFAY